MAYFNVTGDIFPVEAITEALSIEPTKTYKKEMLLKDVIIQILYPQNLYRKETDWTLSTGYQQSYDINNQLYVILKSLEGKTEQLKQLKNKYDLQFLFMVVIQVENNESPAMYLQKILLISLVPFKQKFILIYIFSKTKTLLMLASTAFSYVTICFILFVPQSKLITSISLKTIFLPHGSTSVLPFFFTS